MFGLGMTELLVIFVVALLFLGPEKLPDAAKKLSQGIRDFRQHGRELQRTIDRDTDLGSAVRDLKSALRGDDIRSAVARYAQEPEDGPPSDDAPDDGAPVERESSRPDPYDLRGEAVRAAEEEEADGEHPPDSATPDEATASDDSESPPATARPSELEKS